MMVQKVPSSIPVLLHNLPDAQMAWKRNHIVSTFLSLNALTFITTKSTLFSRNLSMSYLKLELAPELIVNFDPD
jgi:hypothetical protein